MRAVSISSNIATKDFGGEVLFPFTDHDERRDEDRSNRGYIENRPKWTIVTKGDENRLTTSVDETKTIAKIKFPD